MLAGLAGAMLRYAFVGELIAVEYRHLMNAHSHLAMLGWVYAGLFLAFVSLVKLKDSPVRRSYSLLYLASQVIVFFMFISFCIAGYKLPSVILLTLHLILSYLFAINFWKDTNRSKLSSIVKLFLRGSIFFLVFSSLGILAIGPIIAMGLKGTAWYYGAVQFFLHFQFNGFYLFGAMALVCKLTTIEMSSSHRTLRRFFWLLSLACILTYAQAVTWSTPESFIFYINSAGVLLQFVALVYFIVIIRKADFSALSGTQEFLLKFGVLSFALKIFAQTMVALPEIAMVSYTIRNFVIGYIHLINLAILSLILLAWALQFKWLSLAKAISKFGMRAFLLGVIITELLLFTQGIMLWAEKGFFGWYYDLVFAASCLIPLGIIIILLANGHSEENSGDPFALENEVQWKNNKKE